MNGTLRMSSGDFEVQVLFEWSRDILRMVQKCLNGGFNNTYYMCFKCTLSLTTPCKAGKLGIKPVIFPCHNFWVLTKVLFASIPVVCHWCEHRANGMTDLMNHMPAIHTILLSCQCLITGSKIAAIIYNYFLFRTHYIFLQYLV